ncbi:LamG-like jellyroll fold domain-containing protein [Phycicoccus flavus]|uniref:LamG-like jellyroll fold domain-containing protein n=1 Tax=Phycicoccus flavus TaxID=2502783 RepID=UPI001F24CF12|nr:LamG-like jellyroll fold domain-containing protein [Phycicoccus flavus]
MPGPVVHYAFDDDPATGIIADDSGNGLDGTLVNGATASRVAGDADGDALRLPGGSSSSNGAYVRVPKGVLDGRSSVTVTARVSWDGTGGSWQRIFDLGRGTNRYLFTTPSNGSVLRTAVTTNSAGAEAQNSGYAPLPATSWKTVAVTLDTDADRVTTYLDGAAVASATTTATAAQLVEGATSSGFLGKSMYPDPLFSGALDDFAVYGSALTPQQIAAATGVTPPTAGSPTRTEFEVQTTIGTAPALPASVRTSYSDGYDRNVPIVWESVDPARYAQRGTFTVAGDAAGTAVTATVRVIREGEISIDLGTDTGPFKGGAAGALYGLYDDGMPTDNLIDGFGLQTNATKGQDGAQHPGSDALEVLKPLARTTNGDIYIRPTDYYRGFPYQWPGDTPQARLDDYFRVLQTQLDQVKAVIEQNPDLADNIVIEPFNEPEGNMFGTGRWSYNGTSWLNNPTDYFAAWDKAQAMIKKELPDTPVAGPNTSVLFNQVKGFLQHTKDAGTAPDIITWHELSNPASVRTSVDRLRGWEDEVFGTGTDRPINIDEYAFNYHTSVPGQMIQWISAFEDKKVDGMIAFWNLNGNLNDSAVQTNRGNGQWWLYNAYSRMTGHTVKVTPPQPNTSYTLQGVATLDPDKNLAQAIVGGKSGPSLVAFDHVAAAMGEQVRVTVEEIPWTGQIGDSPEPRHVAELTVPVTNGSVALDFGGDALPTLTESSAYRILVSPAGVGTSTSVAPMLWQKSYEAEAASHTGGPYYLNGPEGSPSNVSGFYTSGRRDVGALRTDSDLTLDFSVDAPQDGTYDLQVFSSTLNTFASVQEQGPTNVFVRVDGGQEQEIHLPLAYKWVVWDHADTTVDLTEGTHTISLSVQSKDGTRHTTGDAIVDRIVLGLPNPAAAASVYEGEYAELSGGTTSWTAPAGADVSGPGGATLGSGDTATFWVYAAHEGEQALDVDTVGTARGSLTVNGRAVRYLKDGTARAYLEGGVNKVVVTGTAWVDRLVVAPDVSWLPRSYEAEDARLGGDAHVSDLDLASGGQAVEGVGGEPGNDNTLTFDVTADSAGTYAMTLRFSNPEQVPATHYNPNPVARHADISVNGKLVLPQTMFVPTFHENNFWERTVYLPLKAGKNTISFRSEEEPNWDGETYASDVWGPKYPGLILRSPNAPIIDRIEIAPFTPPQWATATSVGAVLARDGSGPENGQSVNGEDYDLFTFAKSWVLKQKKGSTLALLDDPATSATVFLVDDTAFTKALSQLTGESLPNERAAAGKIRDLPVGQVEQLLLDHVLPGTTLVSRNLLAADGDTLTTAGGHRLTVSVQDGSVRLLSADGDVVAVVDPQRMDVNLGQVQVAHVVDRLIRVG